VTGPEDILNDFRTETKIRIKRKKSDTEITDIEKKILGNMSVMPKFIDDLIRDTGEPVTSVISALSSMKQRGMVAEPMQGFYQIALAYKKDL
jgi:predicted Rossmann fold nucleotide-binding protein DprA/Smf involved in DNA uptake